MTQTDQTRRSLPGLFLAYLVDGLKALPLPMTTIDEASERQMSPAHIAVVTLGFILLAVATGALPALLVAAPAAGNEMLGEIIDAERQMHIVIGMTSGLGLVVLLLSLLILYCIGIVLGGKGSFRRFASAALVLAGVWFVSHIIQVVAAGYMVASPEAAMPALIRTVVPVFFAVLLISFSVLVMRFGSLLSYGRSFAAVLILLVFSALEAVLLGESFFGSLLNAGQLI